LAGTDKPLDLASVRTAMRALLIACRDRWQKEGVDLGAYNTVENAADINDLRQALGYRKLTLIGGSYGSHLALQFMRQYPDVVDRAVIFGVEGPDHTWDSPSAMLATLSRIAEATEQSPVFSGRIPPGGLLKTFERVLQRLDAAPETVSLTVGAQSKQVLIDGLVPDKCFAPTRAVEARRTSGRR
jgi:pimeloyl-ACP methyl ester carboxylesterase